MGVGAAFFFLARSAQTMVLRAKRALKDFDTFFGARGNFFFWGKCLKKLARQARALKKKRWVGGGELPHHEFRWRNRIFSFRRRKKSKVLDRGVVSINNLNFPQKKQLCSEICYYFFCQTLIFRF